MIEILPNDVLLFRESRNFTAGESHVALSQEPLPHTIAGALMGLIYHRADGGTREKLLRLEERRKLAGAGRLDEWAPGFSLLGTFFALNGKALFPLPRDTGLVGEARGKAVVLTLHEVLGRRTVVARDGENLTRHFKAGDGFVRPEELRGYLNGAEEVRFLEKGAVYIHEERVGIGMRETRTVEEGLLYRVRTLRLREGAAIRVYFDSGEAEVMEVLGEKGLLKLGGESRFARYRFIDEGFPLENGELEVKAGAILRLYFATPLLPRNGLRGVLEELGVKGEVVKLFTGRKVRVTGWDVQLGKPKQTLYAYPAGTVVWVKVSEGTTMGRLSKAGGMKELGYGLVIAGVLR
ncbi:type III-B CRISPR module-associated protein Cmr3 [Thermococcus sp. JdF3]|uniref:type III-B CRISPR module-associated protein Cmr3 n=1 Tax=Thermococcus sp. JdF3 TaxID=1638258 RepID=UPI001439DC9B|nr:type III-B CRISPR module-associated protein Cmr3 [Thermococcus sp. JdF3]NJE01393.1 type III-B CRISPR module-associated protein Cmr3 [Thermococcus sp. JdF3]